MANLRVSSGGRRPVRTGEIRAFRKRRPVWLRARKDVVHVGGDNVAAFRHRTLTVDAVLGAVQFGEIDRYTIAERVVPGSLSDAVSRVDGGRYRCRAGAEIRAPRVVTRPLRHG